MSRRGWFSGTIAMWLLASTAYSAAYWYAARPIASTKVWAILLALIFVAQSVLASRPGRNDTVALFDGPLWGALRGVAIAVALFAVAFYPTFSSVAPRSHELLNDLQLRLVFMASVWSGAIGGASVAYVHERHAPGIASTGLTPSWGTLVRRAASSWLGICGIVIAVLAWGFGAESSENGVAIFFYVLLIVLLCCLVTFLVSAVTLRPPAATRTRLFVRTMAMGLLIPVPPFLAFLFLMEPRARAFFGVGLLLVLVLPLAILGALWGATMAGWRWRTLMKPPGEPSVTFSAGTVCVMEAAALLAGLVVCLSATSPGTLGWRGIGCTVYGPITAEEYWFWDGYKGFARRDDQDRSSSGALAVDPKVCFSVADRQANSERVRSSGYVYAVDTWMSLLDADAWDTARGREIRRELAQFIPRRSSYEELSAWWREHRAFMTWTGSGRTLSVDTTAQARGPSLHPDRDELQVTALEYFSNVLGSGWGRTDAMPPGLDSGNTRRGTSYLNARIFSNAVRDRESKQRAFTLLASSRIEVLTGEHARKVRQRLRELTTHDFDTEAEARDWMSRPDAVLGDNRAEIESLITTQLENRSVEIRAAIGDERDARYEGGSLRSLTDQRFSSPDEWVRWWNVNKARLVLSDDGHRLVVRR